MSRPSTNTATRIISHISDGYYLEDYLAIHQKDKVKIFSVKTNYNGVEDFASDIAANDDDADTIESWFKVGVQYSRYDGFNDKFKKFLESVKVTKDNFYTIMPIQNMKTRPNAVYNFK